MKNFLIVMAGGGFPQIENCLGCLKAIQEHCGIDFTSKEIDWRGTSAGGIVATVLSQIGDVNILINAVKRTKTEKLIYKHWFSWLRFFRGGYMYNRDGLEEFIESFIGSKTSENVKVIVTNFKTFQPEEMLGNLQSCLATSSIDKIFPRTEIDGKIYIDGGYNDNVPFEAYMLRHYKQIFLILPPKGPFHRDTYGISNLAQQADLKISQECNEAERIWTDSVNYPNIICLRPAPIENNLLAWSDKFKLIGHAYKYTIQKLKGKI